MFCSNTFTSFFAFSLLPLLSFNIDILVCQFICIVGSLPCTPLGSKTVPLAAVNQVQSTEPQLFGLGSSGLCAKKKRHSHNVKSKPIFYPNKIKLSQKKKKNSISRVQIKPQPLAKNLYKTHLKHSIKASHSY